MVKNGFRILLFTLFLLLLLTSCRLVSTPPEAPSEISLSELQIEACTTADRVGTCNSRLAEVGIVLAEECCQELGKCC